MLRASAATSSVPMLMQREIVLRRFGSEEVPLFDNIGDAVLTLIAGRGARARARSQTSTSKPPRPLQLLLLVRSPSNTHKHTAVRAAVWVLVVACGPVLFELPLRLPSVQIHYERSSAPPASTTRDSKSTRRRTCASARTQPECGRTYRQAGTANNGQCSQHPISAARTSCKSSRQVGSAGIQLESQAEL